MYAIALAIDQRLYAVLQIYLSHQTIRFFIDNDNKNDDFLTLSLPYRKKNITHSQCTGNSQYRRQHYITYHG